MNPILPVSQRFLDAVRGSHNIISTARIIPPGSSGLEIPGENLLIIAGSVTLDSTANVRGSLDLEVAAPWPEDPSVANVTPYGTELQITRGIVYGDGSVERAALGIYRIETVEQPDAPKGPLRVTAKDRMAGIIEARLERPAQYLAGFNTYGGVVSDLVTAVYPDQVIEWDDSTETAPIGRDVIAEDKRFEFLDDLVKSVGKVWFFDHRGVLIVRDPPDPSVPVFEVNAGPEGVLVTVSRAISREGVYNAVVATGEALDTVPPPVAVERDLDPSSVTYYLGPYGKVPRFFSSPFITTELQAESAAASLLLQSVGLPYSVDFTVVPNPALEPLDPVRLTYPTNLLSDPQTVQEIHILDQVQIGLSSEGAMVCGTRLATREQGGAT